MRKANQNFQPIQTHLNQMQGKQGGQPKSEHILDKSIDQASKEEIAQWLKTILSLFVKIIPREGFYWKESCAISNYRYQCARKARSRRSCST
jgi:hypothetical protein